MAYTAAALPRGSTWVAVLPLIVLILALVGYSPVHLWRSGPAPCLPRWAWTVVILLVSPWGAIVYLVLTGDEEDRR